MQTCCSLNNFYRLALLIDVNRIIDILDSDSMTTKICKMSFFDENELETVISNDRVQDPFILFIAIHFISSARHYKSYSKDVNADKPTTEEQKTDQVLEVAFTKIGNCRIDLFSYYDPIRFTDHSRHAYPWGRALANINHDQRSAYIEMIDFSNEIYLRDWMIEARESLLKAFQEIVDENEYKDYCIRVARRWDKWVNEYPKNPDAHAVQSLMTGFWVDVVEGYKCRYSKLDDTVNAISKLLDCHAGDIHTWFPSSVAQRLIFTRLITYLTTFAEVIYEKHWKLEAESELGISLSSVFQDQRLWLLFRDLPVDEDVGLKPPIQFDRTESALFGKDLNSGQEKDTKGKKSVE